MTRSDTEAYIAFVKSQKKIDFMTVWEAAQNHERAQCCKLAREWMDTCATPSPDTYIENGRK